MIWGSLLLLILVAGATATNPSENENVCQACRSIVSYATNFNSSTHRQEYKDLFQGYCELYYSTSTDLQSGPCPIFVEGLFYLLDHTNPIHHCDQIGACSPEQPSDDIGEYLRAGNEVSEPPHRGDNVICQFCEDLINQVKASLSNPKTLDILRHRGDALCDYLKVVDQDKECKQLISKYLDQLVLFLRLIDPKKYCAAVQMCPDRPRRSIARPQAQVQLPTLADFNNFGIETSLWIGPKPSDPTSLRTPECTLCKTIVKEMFHFLRENKTEANIIKGLNRVCSVVYPVGPKLEQCQSMVKAYTRELVQLLVDETDPEVICMLLNECVYTSTPAPIENVTVPQVVSKLLLKKNPTFDLTRLISALDSSIEAKSLRACVECKMFIRFLKDRLDSPTSQNELKQWLLDNLCKELPSEDLVNQCSSMVEAYAEVFFKAVAGNLNPQSACVDLGVCNAKSPIQTLFTEVTTNPISQRPPITKPVEIKKPVFPNKCSKCVEIVSRVDEYMANHTMKQGMAAVAKVCDNVRQSSTSTNECRAIIRLHGADMVQMIPTMESPHQLCKQIVMCDD